MKLPDGRPLVVNDDVLPDPSSEGRVILWVPGECRGGYRHWDRVGTVARAAVTTERGARSIAATAVPARQRLRSPLGEFLGGLIGPRSDRAWTLPDGGSAEPCGPRRTDLRLAWSEDEAVPLDGARINVRWPESGGARPVGPNLYLVSGVRTDRPYTEAVLGPDASLREPPRALAERALAAARGAGDRPGEVTAFIDLGLAHLAEGDALHAVGTLEEALAAARRLGDPAREADALSNLALAALTLGQPGRAREALGPALIYARAAGDRYAEKLALDRIALTSLRLDDHAGALDVLEQARSIAAGLGDLRHEADLLWRAAVEHAELGRRDRALAAAAAAVDRLRGLGNPTADWYAHHLANYRSGGLGAAPVARRTVRSYPGGSIGTTALAAPPGPPAAPAATGPGLLRTALTAAKAMATFVGSGFKTATPEAYRDRLAACAGCAHHTGVRCRVCGCITAAKARLLHERCPAGRWPC